MEAKKIRPKKIYEEVQDMIMERIKSGDLKPGDVLDSVEKTSQIYGVSKSAVREAVSGLRAKGVVETRQGEGTFITHFNPNAFAISPSVALLMQKEDTKEIAVVRRLLEVGTASLAAQMRTEADIERLEKSLALMADRERQGQLGEKADLQFHLDIAKATHNKMLVHLTSSVSDVTLESMRETRRIILYSEAGMGKLYNEHLKIFQAIKAGDPEAAENEMKKHLISVEKVLEPYL